MRPFLKLLSAGIIALMLSGQALAGENLPYYAGIKFGTSVMTADDIENTTDVTNPAQVNEESESDTLGVLGVALGYNWKELSGLPLRTEIEYMYRTDFTYKSDPVFKNAAMPTKVDIDLNVQTLLLSLYLDIPTGTALTPFVGGGVGWAFLESDGDATLRGAGRQESQNNSETNLAWHLGGGVAYAISDRWTADLAYRYVDFGSMEWGNTSTLGLKTGEITAHEFILGLRYSF